MILFTGGGAVAQEFSKTFPCQIISARKMDDYELTSWILKSKIIIHNAAIINVDNFNEYVKGNFLLTKRILDIVYKVKPEIKFINISSMSILKNDENYLDPNSMNNYAFSKFISEQFCLRHPFKDLTNVRFSTIFYEDEKRDGLSKLVYDSVINNEITIYNNGIAKRDIIPIRIVCLYLDKLCNMVTMDRKINIVSGNAKSFKKIVELIQKTNNGMKINNKIINTNEVLSHFSKKDINVIGEIEFDIEEEINNYIKKINENPNL